MPGMTLAGAATDLFSRSVIARARRRGKSARVLVGVDVGEAFAVHPRTTIPLLRTGFCVAPDANMFPGMHDRQAVLRTCTPEALRLSDLLASVRSGG